MRNSIGVFDSGVGGLTVAKAIKKLLPRENILYFGDSIHLPYGNKSEKSILEYSLSNANFLFKKGAKLIVVACNTSSAIALSDLQKKFPIPVLGVIHPGALAAIQSSASGNIAVIGTYRTISSHIYQKEIKQLKNNAKVIEKSCPLFVPIIESGFGEKTIIELIIKNYLSQLSHEVDTLVLGCTHYPLIKSTIKKLFPHLTLVDSALETSKQVFATLIKNKQLNKNESSGNIKIVTNDLNEVFEKISYKLFPKQKIQSIHSFS